MAMRWITGVECNHLSGPALFVRSLLGDIMIKSISSWPAVANRIRRAQNQGRQQKQQFVLSPVRRCVNHMAAGSCGESWQQREGQNVVFCCSLSAGSPTPGSFPEAKRGKARVPGGRV